MNQKPSELKTRLQAVAQNQYNLPPAQELPPLLDAMLQHIGAIDAELRDDLIYSTFAEWISAGKLTGDQMRPLLLAALDEQHLFWKIGEHGTDSVFTRTFSILLLPLLLEVHLAQPFLEDADIHLILDRVLNYLYQEQDHRGYVPEKGWAHATAHTADALQLLALQPTLTAEDLGLLLLAITHLVTIADEVYTHEEGERLSVAAWTIFNRQIISAGAGVDWIDDFSNPVPEETPYLVKMAQRINRKDFLRCIYFRLKRKSSAETLPDEFLQPLLIQIEETVLSLSRF